MSFMSPHVNTLLAQQDIGPHMLWVWKHTTEYNLGRYRCGPLFWHDQCLHNQVIQVPN
jgi:hypothetical protein